MKNILLIILITILFFASVLIFWKGFAPASFLNFFSAYPTIDKVLVKTGIPSDFIEETSYLDFSEPVLATTGQITINRDTWTVEIEDDDTGRTLGLSNRRVLRNKQGMLFVFDQLGFHSFWMKDMLIPIDMIFFDDQWKIVLIESNLQANSFPKTFGGEVKSQYVLEVNSGEANSSGLKVGDRAVFLNK